MKSLTYKIEDQASLVIEYTDPSEGFKGWLVIDNLDNSLCAGGMRVQKGISKNHVIKMARNMTMKMRLCGLPIDGAKCGIDYDPQSPGKQAAMTRFLSAIKPYIQTYYSMGPDLNTSMEELEAIAKEIDVPSIKMAIANAQGYSLPYFLERYKVLQKEIQPGWCLGKIRAGHGVAAAALATLDHLKIPANEATIAIQGFGTLAKAAALSLLKAGAKIIAISDAEKCLEADQKNPLPVESLLENPGTLLPAPHLDPQLPAAKPNSAIFSCKCDILVLAAIENSITTENAAFISAKALVPGANLAVSREAEAELFDRGIPVLPCFLAGCGGSLSMNGLFGPKNHPTPDKVLAYIHDKMSSIVARIMKKSGESNLTPTIAAETIYNKAVNIGRKKPYGL